MGAGDHRARGEDEAGDAGGLDGALEAIPLRGGDAAEFGVGIAAEVEDDEREIAIAQEEIGAAEGFIGSAAADPEQAGKHGFASGGGVEMIVPVDQRGPAGSGGIFTEQRDEERRRAAAG